MFEYQTVIRLHDTDAAGVLFFANQFRLVHEAYEAFLESRGLGLGRLLEQASYALPVVHAHTDFMLPLNAGKRITIKLTVNRRGRTSYTVGHEIFNEDGFTTGRGETVHISIDRVTGKKIPLPPQLVEILPV